MTSGSYEAYCLDQAIWYFGAYLTSELEKAGRKKTKGETRTEAARKKVLDKFIDTPGSKTKKYADPAMLFGV